MTRITVKNSDDLAADAILAICVGRNEAAQLPWFLDYYRKLGVDHFLYIDNDSDDGSRDVLSGWSDVTLYHTSQGYLDSSSGRLWPMQIARSHALDHWCLTLDLDEILVYPMSEQVNLRALTEWMDSQNADALQTLMIDMYPSSVTTYTPHQDFIEASPYFDEGPYWASHSGTFPRSASLVVRAIGCCSRAIRGGAR